MDKGSMRDGMARPHDSVTWSRTGSQSSCTILLSHPRRMRVLILHVLPALGTCFGGHHQEGGKTAHEREERICT